MRRIPFKEADGIPTIRPASSCLRLYVRVDDLDSGFGRLERIEASRRANLSNVPAGNRREGYMRETMMIKATILGLKLRRRYVWNRLRVATGSIPSELAVVSPLKI